jgi:hypothetical protein
MARLLLCLHKRLSRSFRVAVGITLKLETLEYAKYVRGCRGRTIFRGEMMRPATLRV